MSEPIYKKTCSTCRGSRVMPTVGDPYFMKCTACNGAGEVPAIIYNNVTKYYGIVVQVKENEK